MVDHIQFLISLSQMDLMILIVLSVIMILTLIISKWQLIKKGFPLPFVMI